MGNLLDCVPFQYIETVRSRIVRQSYKMSFDVTKCQLERHFVSDVRLEASKSWVSGRGSDVWSVRRFAVDQSTQCWE